MSPRAWLGKPVFNRWRYIRETRQTQGDNLDLLNTVAMNSFSGGKWCFVFNLWTVLFFCSFFDEHGNNDVAVFVVNAIM